MNAELAVLVVTVRGKLDLYSLGSTALVVGNSGTLHSTLLCLCASSTVGHTKVKLDIRVLVDGNIKLPNGK